MDKALIAVDIVEQIRKLEPPGRIDKDENSNFAYNMFKDYNDFSRQFLSNSIYSSQPYPYMPHTNTFNRGIQSWVIANNERKGTTS